MSQPSMILAFSVVIIRFSVVLYSYCLRISALEYIRLHYSQALTTHIIYCFGVDYFAYVLLCLFPCVEASPTPRGPKSDTSFPV